MSRQFFLRNIDKSESWKKDKHLSEIILVSKQNPSLAMATTSVEDPSYFRRFGWEVIPFAGCDEIPPELLELFFQPGPPHGKTLTDVLTHIKAPLAWKHSMGDGVSIAIIDSGVCGSMKEFPAWKRLPYEWSFNGSSAWIDDAPPLPKHGSMVACIAAGTSENGGKYDGVAPKANLISCKTNFNSGDLVDIYAYLVDLVKKGKVKRLVINNSFCKWTCKTPPPDNSLKDAILTAINAGIVVVFAAGDNHSMCNYDPTSCSGNTIWGVNSLDPVICVGTIDASNNIYAGSSRGPGEWSKVWEKPDCVAPTYGNVMWGCGYQAFAHGWWGTSGAAPQIAGLAALMLAKRPTLTPDQVHQFILKNCVALPAGKNCVGAGLINCDAAVRAC